MESDDFTGQGLFFNFRLALFVALGIIGLSCLWWAPFVWHLARPLLGMADYAERIAAEGHEGVHVHLYGKTESRPKRKMGHITFSV